MAPDPEEEAFPGTCFVIAGPQELGFLYKLADAEQCGLTLGSPCYTPLWVPPPSSGRALGGGAASICRVQWAPRNRERPGKEGGWWQERVGSRGQDW